MSPTTPTGSNVDEGDWGNGVLSYEDVRDQSTSSRAEEPQLVYYIYIKVIFDAL